MLNPLLYNLFLNIKQIKGVGDKKLDAFKKLGCLNIKGLLFHFPVSIIDRRNSPPLNDVQNESIITTVVEIQNITKPKRFNTRLPYKVECANDTGALNLVYFNANPQFIERTFIVNKKIAVSGVVNYTGPTPEIIHPHIIADPNDYEKIKRIEPVYPQTYGLSSRYISAVIKNALPYVPPLPEWIPSALLQKHNWLSWLDSIKKIHFPTSIDDISPNHPPYERLVFDEILAHQLMLGLARNTVKKANKNPVKTEFKLTDKLKTLLPFQLTKSQETVIAEIIDDQISTNRMFRLLQGDVGSGKTIVALYAMLNAIEGGKQAALMVPTEILALQHYRNFQKLTESLGVKIALLVSDLKPSEKDDIITKIAENNVNLIIGTHALFQEKVNFKNLGLVVIDEQHRFGVEQRLSLVNKGVDADFLMMTATPIPRTMAMIGYGDMDISIINEKPANRQIVETTIIKANRINELVNSINKVIEKGEKVYWVCPLIEESEKVDFANATKRFESLKNLFPEVVGLIHGKMKAQDRNAIMNDFINGKTKILVATTIIEVGVDIPDATVIVIEDAERFGLSQLHQLRGRVGRSDKKSFCVLLVSESLGQNSYSRLKVIRDNHDGFHIAEQDLHIRGSGDVLGTKQSGLPSFKIYNYEKHTHLLLEARKLAQDIIRADPNLSLRANDNIKLLLQVFEHDKYMNLLKFN